MPQLITVSATGRHGDGVVEHDGRSLFIPQALAGDVVEIALLPDGSLQSATIMQRGAAYAEPPCQHFGACGGCVMQHMQPNAYQAWKQNFVAAALQANGLVPERLEAPSVSPPHSRRRATFAAERTGKIITLGFHQARSTTIIPLQMCSVLRPEITALLPQLRLLVARLLGNSTALDVRITLLDGVLDVLIIGGVCPGLRERTVLAAFAETAAVGRISWGANERSAAEMIVERQPVRAFFAHGAVLLPPGGFLQATQAGEAALCAAVSAAIGTAAPVADLFCGVGTFALSLAPRRLLAVDADAAAIAALQQALRHETRATILRRDLLREPMLAKELAPFKAVIFDPPRSGAKAQAEELAKSRVPTIVAISCDLNSFCRDAKILVDGGYRLQQVHIIDQFLWSTHVELAGIFQRSSSGQ
jgi:23S rRNA (uracil1939-C5)-methyltransferase